MKPKITPSTGNVFRDLGFRREEAEHLLVRADLMIQIQKLIAVRGLRQKAAVKTLGVRSHASAISSAGALFSSVPMHSLMCLLDLVRRFV
jgi:predicted XRE-type DNA-binding protein